eukprot:Skav226310  [mRNA]  locus=scaffold3301:540555:563104:- [translate_table: standard]
MTRKTLCTSMSTCKCSVHGSRDWELRWGAFHLTLFTLNWRAVSKEVALLLTELSKLWCSPELSAEDAQARANTALDETGKLAQEDKEPIAAQRSALKTEIDRLTKLRSRQSVEVQEHSAALRLGIGDCIKTAENEKFIRDLTEFNEPGNKDVSLFTRCIGHLKTLESAYSGELGRRKPQKRSRSDSKSRSRSRARKKDKKKKTKKDEKDRTEKDKKKRGRESSERERPSKDDEPGESAPLSPGHGWKPDGKDGKDGDDGAPNAPWKPPSDAAPPGYTQPAPWQMPSPSDGHAAYPYPHPGHPPGHPPPRPHPAGAPPAYPGYPPGYPGYYPPHDAWAAYAASRPPYAAGPPPTGPPPGHIPPHAHPHPHHPHLPPHRNNCLMWAMSYNMIPRDLLNMSGVTWLPGQSIALDNRGSRSQSTVLTPSLKKIADKDVEVELRGLAQPLFKVGGKMGNVVTSSSLSQIHRGWRIVAVNGQQLAAEEVSKALAAAQKTARYTLTFRLDEAKNEENEKIEKDRLEKDRLEKERLERERLERERERLEKEQAERLEKERLAEKQREEERAERAKAREEQKQHTLKRAAREVAEKSLEQSTGLPPREKVQEPQRALLAALAPSTSPAATPAKPTGPCDKCDGPHATDECPHFKKPRDDHKDAYENYQKMQKNLFSCTQRLPGLVALLGRFGSCTPEGSGASTLRAEIADYIAAHPAEEVAGNPVSDWVLWDSGEDPASYARSMRAGSRWGGAMEIALCAKLRHAFIEIFERRSSDNSFVRIASFGDSREANRVRLLYGGRIHYDALEVRLQGQTRSFAMRMPPSYRFKREDEELDEDGDVDEQSSGPTLPWLSLEMSEQQRMSLRYMAHHPADPLGDLDPGLKAMFTEPGMGTKKAIRRANG